MTLPFTLDLSGKTAVVTGGAGVLLSPMCQALAQCGAKVAVLNRTFSKAEALCSQIERDGGVALPFSADVCARESLEGVHAQVQTALGPCSILINGVGGNDPSASTADEFYDEAVARDPGRASFFDLKAGDVERVLSANFTSAFLSTQVFAQDMLRGGGCVLNVSSMNAFTPLTKIPAYSAAKAALSNFTQWMAVYFAKAGVRVNAIAPGFFSSEQNRALLWNPDGTPTPRTDKILANTPMGRFGQPAELLGAMLFLLDEAASGFITGVVLPVDGGFSAYSGV